MTGIRKLSKRKVALAASLLLIAPLIAGCSQALTHNFTDVIAQEAFDLIDENANNPDFVVLDVRTTAEYQQGHLADAILINYRAPSFAEEIDKLPKDKTYLVYCRTGNRSRGALEVMAELGFEDVYHLTTGVTGWKGAGFPVVK